MARYQNTPRESLALRQLTLQDGSGNTVVIGSDANGAAIQGKLTLNSDDSGLYLGANTTGYILEAIAEVPSTETAAQIALVTNSTATYLMVNQTGTTWAYLSTTSVAPTLG